MSARKQTKLAVSLAILAVSCCNVGTGLCQSNRVVFRSPGPTPTTTTTPVETPQPTPKQLNLPTFPSNVLVIPSDQNTGNTGVSSIQNKGSKLLQLFTQEVTFKGQHLPSFLAEKDTSTQHVEEDIPANAVVIDTGEEDGALTLPPVSFYQGESNHFRPVAYADNSPNLAGKIVGSPVDSESPVVIQVNEKRCNLVVFSGNGQLVAGEFTGTKDGLVAGTPGTTLSTDRGVITLHAGKLLIDTGSAPIRIATKTAGLKLEPNSSAIIEILPDRSVRVVGLTDSGAKVRAAISPDRIFSPGKNEAIVVSDKPIDPADASFIGQQVSAATEDLDNQQIEKVHLSSSSQYARDLLKMPNAVAGKKKPSFDRMMAHLQLQTVAPHAMAAADLDPIRVLAGNGTQFIPEAGGGLHLVRGKLFVVLPGFAIRTALGELRTEKETVAQVERSTGLFRIQSCAGPKLAYMLTGGKYMAYLNDGEEVVITDHAPTQSDAMPSDDVGRRHFDVQKLDNGTTIVASDFSIGSLMLSAKHLHSLRRPQCASDCAVRERLLKTAAALVFATDGRGKYITAQSCQSQPSG